MDWEQFAIFTVVMAGFFIISRNDSKAMLSVILSIKDEIKDFHGRLCALATPLGVIVIVMAAFDPVADQTLPARREEVAATPVVIFATAGVRVPPTESQVAQFATSSRKTHSYRIVGP
jgi:hypothetical protein